ncbi:ABC transporter substrate-binding protein [Albimonas sp. CAU 1670]|uniref:ABC transporter substrate-binding protein n=1 Tax=Albimonas sp. CAU 1670 TaxID=3032599 RepID=UPI0023DA9FFC|nr:ABC transporter substrate-binding protein [Albimonas sp. CAU 1670]MDF2234773.1 ABC transporter substrate-binding protein [Albimonas sp. CAU 1670]
MSRLILPRAQGVKPSRRAVLAGGAAVFAMAAAPRARAAEPKKGGEFRLVASGNTSDSHDPATWGTSGIINIGLWGAVYNNLTEVHPSGEVIGELAESFEPSVDAKTWTFRLREGITFHGGQTLEASDVAASINHHRGEGSSSSAKGIVAPIADIATPDARTVVFELDQGNADFPFILTDYHLVIGKAVEGKIDWETPNGTGGYTFVSHDPGVRMVLERNRDYWKEGRAHFDHVELLSIRDPAARMNALVTGEVDAISSVDIKSMSLLGRARDIEVMETPGTQHYTFPMWCDAAPFEDVAVRQALKHAIDREAMLKTILKGHGSVGKDSPITPANRFFNAELATPTYDPEKAKSLLKKAGHDRLSVDLSAADAAFAGAVDAATLFQESAAAAGIDINVVREPDDGYWSNVWLKKPFCASYWAGRPTEDWMFSQVYASDSKWNDAHWKNPRFDSLLLEARAELDPAKRAEMYGEMQTLVSEDGGTIIPLYANYIDARNTRIAHGELSTANALDGWKCIERWWVA